jgi:hypothetical protein
MAGIDFWPVNAISVLSHLSAVALCTVSEGLLSSRLRLMLSVQFCFGIFVAVRNLDDTRNGSGTGKIKGRRVGRVGNDY